MRCYTSCFLAPRDAPFNSGQILTRGMYYLIEGGAIVTETCCRGQGSLRSFTVSPQFGNYR